MPARPYVNFAYIDPDIRQQDGYKAASRLWRDRGIVGLESRPPSDVLEMLQEIRGNQARPVECP